MDGAEVNEFELKGPVDFCRFPPKGPLRDPPNGLLLNPPKGLLFGGILGTSNGLEFLGFWAP